MSSDKTGAAWIITVQGIKDYQIFYWVLWFQFVFPYSIHSLQYTIVGYHTLSYWPVTSTGLSQIGDTSLLLEENNAMSKKPQGIIVGTQCRIKKWGRRSSTLCLSAEEYSWSLLILMIDKGRSSLEPLCIICWSVRTFLYPLLRMITTTDAWCMIHDWLRLLSVLAVIRYHLLSFFYSFFFGFFITRKSIMQGNLSLNARHVQCILKAFLARYDL